MKMKMLRTTRGSPDGVNINLYEAGKEYDLPESLARAFMSMKVAMDETEDGRPKTADGPRSSVGGRKDAGKAPENK